MSERFEMLLLKRFNEQNELLEKQNELLAIIAQSLAFSVTKTDPYRSVHTIEQDSKDLLKKEES